jgi:cysteinyl-tRNA synthetase
MVVFDTVARYFRHLGYDLTYVRNITDIDDKIIQRANDKGEDFNQLTEHFIDAMHEDEDALKVLRPDIEPRATQSIDAIKAMIEVLLAKGYAYIGGNGDVFYAVEKFKDYGNLSGKKLEDLQAGERVDVDTAKQNPFDFVLWKMAKANEPSWPSPWGDGRPGWHIECSAMSTCCLGNHFDIHGGGMDLQFPHHENEIAQSEGATGEKFVNLWMHNGFVRVNEEKMSKSLGNFFTVREVLKQYRPEIIRYFILWSHYRSPLNYSDEQLNEAKAGLDRFYTALRDCDVTHCAIDEDYKVRFEQAMDDDFNTHAALLVLFDLAKELNISKSKESMKSLSETFPDLKFEEKPEEPEKGSGLLASTLKQLGGLLGLLQADPDAWLKGNVADKSAAQAEAGGLSEAAINQQIKARLEAKKAKNWALADQIRDQLKEQGIILEDAPNGTTSWRRG